MTKTTSRKKKSMGVEVLRVKKVWLDRSGCFEIRREVVDDGGGNPLEWEMAYSIHGHYMGDVKMARALAKRRIVAELATPEHTVCSVGYSPRGKRWFGWSHRAIVGFKKGDRVFEERFPGATDKTPFRRHGRLVIETLADARLAAVRFANSVS